jgi:hypothetical protein
MVMRHELRGKTRGRLVTLIDVLCGTHPGSRELPHFKIYLPIPHLFSRDASQAAPPPDI